VIVGIERKWEEVYPFERIIDDGGVVEVVIVRLGFRGQGRDVRSCGC